MPKWTINKNGHRYVGGADPRADQIEYGFRFEALGANGPATAHVEILEGAPHTKERDARNALLEHVEADEPYPASCACETAGFTPSPSRCSSAAASSRKTTPARWRY